MPHCLASVSLPSEHFSTRATRTRSFYSVDQTATAATLTMLRFCNFVRVMCLGDLNPPIILSEMHIAHSELAMFLLALIHGAQRPTSLHLSGCSCHHQRQLQHRLRPRRSRPPNRQRPQMQHWQRQQVCYIHILDHFYCFSRHSLG